MKLAGVLLSCYIMFLSLLPGIELTRKQMAKPSCGQCCRKPKGDIENSPAENPKTSNPFYGCVTCSQAICAEYGFLIVKAIPFGRVKYNRSSRRSYKTPLFGFWHPPQLLI
jgi:hypothetical protein